MPTYRSHFPDFIGMVTKQGDKFNFTGGLLETEDPTIIEILDERVNRQKDVTKISVEEAASIKAANDKKRGVVNIEEKINENREGETTISPQALMERIRMTQAAQTSEKVASQQLEVAQQIIKPQSGIVSSATLEAAAPSNAKPATKA